MQRAAFLLSFCAAAARGLSFNLTNALGSHAVLQREKPVRLWGWASEPQSISAAWVDGKTYRAASDATGLWVLEFPATAAVTTPFNLSLTSSTGDALSLDDLLLGDVFLCAGQCSYP